MSLVSTNTASGAAPHDLREGTRPGRYVVEGLSTLEQNDIAGLFTRRAGEVGPPYGLTLATAPGIYVSYDETDEVVPNDVRVAVEWAAAEWEEALAPKGPVTIDFVWHDFGPQSSGLLGAAGVHIFDQATALATDAYVPGAVLNHHAGVDLFPGLTEGGIVLNANMYGTAFGWCTSLDPDACKTGTFDLPTTLLHEFAHALGHVSSAHQSAGRPPRFASPPDLYDTHILYTPSDLDVRPLLDLDNPESYLESGHLSMYWGPGGNYAHHYLHAPNPYEPGSSISHLDEATYGAILMTPYGDPYDDRYRKLTDTERARMQLIGWGELLDGRTHPPGLPASCQGIVDNPVIGSNGGPFAETLRTDPSAARIWRLYGVMFRRHPDQAGFDYWRSQHAAGLSMAEITNSFAKAEEVTALYSDSLRNEVFVSTLYRNAFGRCEDDAGHTYWVGQLAIGRTTRGDVLSLFAESEEFGLRTGTLQSD